MILVSGYLAGQEPPRGFLLTVPEGTLWRFDGGLLASVDGLRFVVPVCTINAGS